MPFNEAQEEDWDKALGKAESEDTKAMVMAMRLLALQLKESADATNTVLRQKR